MKHCFAACLLVGAGLCVALGSRTPATPTRSLDWGLYQIYWHPAHVSADPRLTGFIYFNHDKRREGEPNWRLDSDPESLRIFQAWAKHQREQTTP